MAAVNPEALSLDAQTTALVLIDLQRGIVNRPLQPHSSNVVISNAVRLLTRFRETGGAVVLVHVGFSADGKDALRPKSDEPPMTPPPDPSWMEYAPELGHDDRDLHILKRNWGAFYGTELDLQLRRRGVRTIVLGGVATNMGVESTARDAFERGYEQVFVEDGMASMSAEAHSFAVKNIFPRMGRVRTTDQVLAAFQT